jgi:hypothetical protein
VFRQCNNPARKRHRTQPTMNPPVVSPAIAPERSGAKRANPFVRAREFHFRGDRIAGDADGRRDALYCIGSVPSTHPGWRDQTGVSAHRGYSRRFGVRVRSPVALEALLDDLRGPRPVQGV